MNLLYNVLASRGVAQFGRVPEWGSGGRRFESSHSDHFNATVKVEKRRPKKVYFLKDVFLMALWATGVSSQCAQI